MARIIGVEVPPNKRIDIALLKIEANGLPVVKLGEPSQLKVGEWVVAIGSPFGFDNSVTAGILSAFGRTITVQDGTIIRKLVAGQQTTDFEELHLLTPGMCWSPDSRRLALTAKSGARDAIMLIDVEGGEGLEHPGAGARGDRTFDRDPGQGAAGLAAPGPGHWHSGAPSAAPGSVFLQ